MLHASPAWSARRSLPLCHAARGAQDEDSIRGLALQEGGVAELQGSIVDVACHRGGAVLNKYGCLCRGERDQFVFVFLFKNIFTYIFFSVKKRFDNYDTCPLPVGGAYTGV